MPTSLSRRASVFREAILRGHGVAHLFDGLSSSRITRLAFTFHRDSTSSRSQVGRLAFTRTGEDRTVQKSKADLQVLVDERREMSRKVKTAITEASFNRDFRERGKEQDERNGLITVGSQRERERERESKTWKDLRYAEPGRTRPQLGCR